jgi:hypothetical protein
MFHADNTRPCPIAALSPSLHVTTPYNGDEYGVASATVVKNNVVHGRRGK